jgi:hypothetical protein
MRLAILLFAFVALSALAADPKPAPNAEKARQACKAEAAKAPAKHPADIVATQRAAFDLCMREKGVHTKVIRAK